MFSRIACALAVGAALSFGCAHEEAVSSDVQLTSAPVNLYNYPSVVYQGHPVYYYRGYWYFHDNGDWHYYVHEPQVLYQIRMQHPEWR